MGGDSAARHGSPGPDAPVAPKFSSMRRRWWHRGLSALLAVWFALVVAEPAALHACPMHSAAEPSTSSADASQAAHGGHAGHAAPSADRQAGDHRPADDAHVCTCLGDCSGTVVASVPTATTAPVVPVRLTAVTLGRPQHEFVAAWADFVLPFATAPPAPAGA